MSIDEWTVLWKDTHASILNLLRMNPHTIGPLYAHLTCVRVGTRSNISFKESGSPTPDYQTVALFQ